MLQDASFGRIATATSAAIAVPMLFLALFFLGSTVDGLTPDGHSLLAFKSSIDDPLSALANWIPSDDTPCRWNGIFCDEQGRVSSISLSNMSLSGSIAANSVSNLAALTNLSLDLNDFRGAASLPPDVFANLPLLRHLNISHCNLSGEFPTDLSGLSSLAVLDAYNNNFTGPLPIGLSSLGSLVHVHLGGSLFSGSIPAEYGSVRSLRYLALSGNDLSGAIPPEMGRLATLEQLYLGYYNNFSSGPVPDSFGRLKSLRVLDLASCGVTGTIPPQLGDLRHLDTLFLQLNSLSGTVPDSLGRLSGLKSLDLSCNQLTGTIPASLENLQKLELLSLFRNNLSGEIPSFVGDMPNLQVLFLWGNRFRGGIPEFLGRNGQLQKLDLSKNELNGSIPSNLCRGQLDTIILQQNRLSGTIPADLGSCPTLEKVRLGDNLLSGGIPRGLLGLPRLDMLELMQNRLDGMISDVEFAAPLLEKIDISENALRGEIPEGIGSLASLKELHVAYNRISGAVPPGLGRMTGLLQLNLTHNEFTGGIPLELGQCRSLTMLDLSANQLSGEIPASLGQLEVLGVLNLSKNALSGGIPRGVALLQSLNSADFSYNRLSGAIPAMDQAFNRSSYVGNLALCGAPLGPCSKNGKLPGGIGGTARHSGRSDPELLAWLVGALFSAALLVLVVGVCCFFRKYRRYLCKLGLLRRRGRSSGAAWKLTAFQKLGFTAANIVECLTEENVIGRGGSGVVYRGVMPSGEIVAVKKLSPAVAAKAAGKIGGSVSHSDHGFSAEVQTLGKIRHRNIVKLLGFCSNKETNVLVYEYMPNGSLGEALHNQGSKKGAMPLDWTTRYKIALQAANGLCYLHHDCSPLIVHRDVKSNNILLDAEFQARVADFGLAKLFQDSGKSESMSSIAGSYGYIAPEYAYTLKVNEKSDIYSFGVVLLELVSGRRPIEPEFGDGVDIVQWMRKKIQTKDGMLEVLDAGIREENLPLQEVMLVLRVALLCTSDLPVDRPTMRDVVQMLGDARPGKSKDESTDFGDLSSSQSQLLSPV